MSEQFSHEPEKFEAARPLTISVAELFVGWYEKTADAVDLHAKSMQLRLEDDPSLAENADFIKEKEQLEREKQLLENVGAGVSAHTLSLDVDRFIDLALDEDTNK